VISTEAESADGASVAGLTSLGEQPTRMQLSVRIKGNEPMAIVRIWVSLNFSNFLLF